MTEVLDLQRLADKSILVAPDAFKCFVVEVSSGDFLDSAVRHSTQELADTFDWYKVFLV